jgi:hypothetical protein
MTSLGALWWSQACCRQLWREVAWSRRRSVVESAGTVSSGRTTRWVDVDATQLAAQCNRWLASRRQAWRPRGPGLRPSSGRSLRAVQIGCNPKQPHGASACAPSYVRPSWSPKARPAVEPHCISNPTSSFHILRVNSELEHKRAGNALLLPRRHRRGRAKCERCGRPCERGGQAISSPRPMIMTLKPSAFCRVPSRMRRP